MTRYSFSAHDHVRISGSNEAPPTEQYPFGSFVDTGFVLYLSCKWSPMPDSSSSMNIQHRDVIIIGAGLSGIDAACHLKMECPSRSFIMFEGRHAIGGTWDFFTYPGIRSDSDMHTFSYSFKPWTYHQSISDAETILQYLNETVEEYDIRQHIQFNTTITRVSWSSETKRWTVSGIRKDTGETIEATCNFLFLCTGYYDYEEGYTPDFPGLEEFEGRFIHPQKWSDDVEYEGKQVIVIGSGATAVTLIPAMAEKAAHITMLQRSPGYIVGQPLRDPFARLVHAVFPSRMAHFLARWKNILRDMLFFRLSRRRPQVVKRFIKKQIRKILGPAYDVDTHFHPRYNPWDERLCSVPDNDLFHAIKDGRCSVVTDHIETFTPTGIRCQSGKELEADLIVSATGLKLKLAGGIEVLVNEEPIDLSTKLNYKGSMLQDVPNAAIIVGYTNASWTLKADLVCSYVCRLLKYMDAHGHSVCVPLLDRDDMKQLPLIDFSSGYIQRSLDKLPKQGDRSPWRLNQNYIQDRKILTHQPVNDGVLRFSER